MPLLLFFLGIVRKIVLRDWGPEAWRIPIQAFVKLLLLIMLFIGAVLLLVAALAMLPLIVAVIGVVLVVVSFTWLISFFAPHLLATAPSNPIPMPTTTPTSPPPLDVIVDPGLNPNAEYDAVFEGGGVKAIAHIGALKRLEDAGLKPRHVAGTSGGAVIGGAVVAGGKAVDIWGILTDGDLTRVLDARTAPNRPLLRHPLYALTPLIPGLLLDKSMFRGLALREFLRESLAGLVGGPPDPTFKDLPGFPDQKVHLIAADITRRVTVDFPSGDTAADYEKWPDPELMPVADAVYMSAAIPFFFAPKRLLIKDTTVEADLVDGGVTSGFPIWVFDVPCDPEIPTFGFLLEEGKAAPSPIRNVLSFAWNLIQTGIGSADKILSEHNETRTIEIPIPPGITSTDFDLSQAQQVALFVSGYEAADSFLQSFVWSDYVLKYRCKAAP
ncbi:MAG: patatin-like phospholipase family protein [Chloroflexi bacterium]|nr:patatin-like phospholipase family protein [Chloroflexota bacterium]